LLITKDKGITLNSTVKELRSTIASKIGMKEHDFNLVYANKWLGEEYSSHKLSEFGIGNNSNLVITIPLLGGSYTNVMLVNKRLVSVYADRKDTVKTFKEKIYMKNKILDPEIMNLSYQNVILKDNQKILDIRILPYKNLIQTKVPLSEVKGIEVSFAPDIISYDSSKKA